MNKPATANDLQIGTKVLYSPSLGGKMYRGTVAGELRSIGDTEVVRLEELEAAYGVDTGRPGRTTVVAAAISNIFIDGERLTLEAASILFSPCPSHQSHDVLLCLELGCDNCSCHERSSAAIQAARKIRKS